MLPLNDKDLAGFALNAIAFSLLDFHAVRKWGDQLLLSQDDPMPWAVDLACCQKDDVENYLEQVPGVTDRYIPNLLCCGLLRRRWRQERVTFENARTIGVLFYWNHSLPSEIDALGNWTERFYRQTEDWDCGRLTDDELRSAITQHLEPFGEWEDRLPGWVE